MENNLKIIIFLGILNTNSLTPIVLFGTYFAFISPNSIVLSPTDIDCVLTKYCCPTSLAGLKLNNFNDTINSAGLLKVLLNFQ